MKCTQSKILKHLALFGYGDGSGYGNGYGSGEKDPAKAGAVVVEK